MFIGARQLINKVGNKQTNRLTDNRQIDKQTISEANKQTDSRTERK